MTWQWPLAFKRPDIPTGDHPGAFGVQRKHDVHTGVDLYTGPGTPVVTVEDGIIARILPFTGPKAGSPWWHDTQCILVEGESGVVCYGELYVLHQLCPGTFAPAGALLGYVAQVLKKDKGKPMSMLHLELYKHGTREPALWLTDRPLNLLDPTHKLQEIP